MATFSPFFSTWLQTFGLLSNLRCWTVPRREIKQFFLCVMDKRFTSMFELSDESLISYIHMLGVIVFTLIVCYHFIVASEKDTKL